MTSTTVPGFSSRSTDSNFKQLPQRDEAAMSEMQPEPGFSNSEAVDHAPDDVHPEVAEPEELVPGFSNGKAVVNDDAPAEEPAADDSEESAEPKKTAAKKTAKKKG